MTQNSSGHGLDDDSFWLFLFVCVLVAFGGLGFLAAKLKPLQDWLVAHLILATGDGVLIGWSEPLVGLDISRILIIAGVIALLLVACIASARKRIRKGRRDV